MIDYRFICLVIITNIGWGLQPLIQKQIYKNQTSDGKKQDPVLAVVIVTAYLYCIVLTLFGLTKQSEIKEEVARFKFKTLFMLLTNAIFCFFIPIVSANYLIKNYDPATVVSTTSVYPMISLFVGYLLKSNKITKKNLSGIVLLVVGVALVNLEK